MRSIVNSWPASIWSSARNSAGRTIWPFVEIVVFMQGKITSYHAPVNGVPRGSPGFKSGNLTLVGPLQAEQTGAVPALIWNHGSEKDPGSAPQFDAVAAVFARHSASTSDNRARVH